MTFTIALQRSVVARTAFARQVEARFGRNLSRGLAVYTDGNCPMTDDREPGRKAYPAERARLGEIVLRKRWQRIVFISGLAGSVLLVLILQLWLAASGQG